MKFLCDQCKAKYQIADDKVAGKTVRMKCRKCGHVIEIRAAVTESSSASERPAAPTANSPLAARRPAPPQPRRDALTSAMQKNIASPDVDTSGGDPTAPDEWYVAINGVPVGPIGISELRRKSASGSVTDASLVWREGLEEWRPLRTITELAALVRDAASSLPPRAPSRPAPPPRASLRAPAPQPGPSIGGPAMRPPSPPARSNVIPLRSDRPAASVNVGGAAAAMTASPDPFATSPLPPVAADPFAMPPPAAMAAHVGGQFGASEQAPAYASAAADPFAIPPAPRVADVGRASMASIMVPAKKPFPWGPVSMLAAAIAFGITAGVVFFLKKDQPQIVIQTVPGPVQTVVGDPHGNVPLPATADTATPVASASGKASGGPIAAAGPRPSATASSGGAADLKGLGLGLGGTGPSGPAGSAAAGGSGPGGSLSEADVQRTVSSYTPGVKRKCWDTAPPGTTSVNVMANITVGGDGSVQGVSANGSDATVANCIQTQIRNWRFPATGGKSSVNVPFKFVRQ